MHPLPRALRRAALVLVMAAAVVPTAAANPAPAAAASYSGFYTDFSSMELMRLTNQDRVALGRPRLKVDAYLTNLARDLSFTCPRTGVVYKGRARDMATRGYLAHGVKGCRKSDGSDYTVQDILRRAGYSTYTGENIGVNNWPDSGALYRYGCSSSGTSCKGTTKSTAPVATVEKMWMRSSGHRSNILNSHYDRFGCAAWDTSDGHKYFACIFSRGGSRPVDRTAPSVTSTGDNLATKRKGDSVVLTASFSDSFRLADGWVLVDGAQKRGWSYDYNRNSTSESVTLDPATLSQGTHSVTWAIRDVAGHVTYRSTSFTVH